MTKFILTALLFSFLPLLSAKADVDLSKPLDLKYTAIDGRKVDLTKLRGKVVLIDFWATWCPPCRLIAPDILKTYKKYHEQGFEVVGVSADSDRQALVNFVKEEGAPWPQYFMESDSDPDILGQYGIQMFPTLWLVDKKGVVVNAHFMDHWVTDGQVNLTTSPETFKAVDDEIEKYLKAH